MNIAVLFKVAMRLIPKCLITDYLLVHHTPLRYLFIFVAKPSLDKGQQEFPAAVLIPIEVLHNPFLAPFPLPFWASRPSPLPLEQLLSMSY